MAYIGKEPLTSFVSLKRQDITGDGTASYTLDHKVASVNDILVYVNHIKQDPSSMTVSGTSLTMGGTVSSSDDFYVIFLGQALQTVTPADNTITNSMLTSGSFSNITGTGTLTNFTSTGIDDNATSTAITIDSSERVGIGETTPSDGLLVIKGDSDDNTTPSIRLKDGTDAREAWITNTAGDLYLTTGGDDNVPHSQIRMLNGNVMTFRTSDAEKMRIGSGVQIATTTQRDGAPLTVYGNGVAQIVCEASATTNGFTAIFFRNPAGTQGQIITNASSVAYQTTSDHRLKENVVSMTNATDRLKQLKPKRFNFIADADTTVDGFLAHEVQSVVPEAISGTHNQIDADGNPVYQGIDQAKLVPLLVKTIQELEARITTLETKVTALENA